MKYILAVFSTILCLSCGAEMSNTSAEKEFWELIADFELNFKHEEVTEESLEKLAFLATEFDDSLAKKELILRRIQFLKAYSSLEGLDFYLTTNLKMISEKHNDYLKLYTDHIVLLSLLGSKEKESRMEELLEQSDDKVARSYALALSLYLRPTESSYKNLEGHCSANCNFSLYHISIMEYLKSNKKFEELEKYAKFLINSLLSKELMVNDVFFVDYVMTYLEVSLKNLSKDEMAAYFLKQSNKNYSDKSFMYIRLKKIKEIKNNKEWDIHKF